MPINPQDHGVTMSNVISWRTNTNTKIKHFNSTTPQFLFGRQDWVKGEFQIKVLYLIHKQTENRLSTQRSYSYLHPICYINVISFVSYVTWELTSKIDRKRPSIEINILTLWRLELLYNYGDLQLIPEVVQFPHFKVPYPKPNGGQHY